ncbi:hypothetical protein HPB47_021785 [Ixodes persulcatus]|uniref:Uncharacterized protein n=1 Tax=Ixodes persulcatus TaxID=34615 RepID=A0AC60QCH9_IXOPE|nr:hypothetical protein HPB47_021785 [Ixodes persulcatus]
MNTAITVHPSIQWRDTRIWAELNGTTLRRVGRHDEKSQTISTNCRLTQQRWTDAHLKWNASDFGGIGVLRIPAAQVWKPDLVLYNKHKAFDLASMDEEDVVRQFRFTKEDLSHLRSALLTASIVAGKTMESLRSRLRSLSRHFTVIVTVTIADERYHAEGHGDVARSARGPDPACPRLAAVFPMTPGPRAARFQQARSYWRKNARGDYRSGQLSSNVIVKWTGEVAFPVQAVLTSACQLELHYFPFDVHNCHLHFVSWTYDVQQARNPPGVELEPSRTAEALTRFQRHGEFELVGLSVSQRMHQSATDAGGASTTPSGSSDDGGGLGAPAAHRDVTYSVRLRRRPGFHLFHLVLPCLLVNALALLSFFVPCESGEKVTLGINTLLCVAVFLVVVRDSLPPGGTMLPLISVYYGLTICVVACTTGLSVLTLSLHHRGARGVEVPRSLRRLVLGFLAKLFLVGCCAPHGDDAQRKIRVGEKWILEPFSEIDSSLAENLEMGPGLIQIFRQPPVDSATRL